MIIHKLIGEKSTECTRVKEREMKSPPNQMQALCDSYYLFQWTVCHDGDNLIDQIKEFHDMIAHYGNKVIMKKRGETDGDVKWMEAHNDLCKTFRDFCVSNAGELWHWNGKGKADGFVEWFDEAANTDKLNDFSFMGAISGGASGGAPAQAAPTGGSKRAGKDLGTELTGALADKVTAVKAAAGALGVAQVIKATDQFVAMVGFQSALLSTMGKFKKPADNNFLKNPYVALAQDLNQVKDRDMKAPVNHMKAICDAVSMFFWFSAAGQDDCVDYVKEFHGQIFFWSNKILKDNKENDIKWTNAFTDLATALKDFIVARAETILEWTGKEDGAGAAAFYEGQCKSGAPAATTTAAAPVEEKKSVPTPAAKPVAAAGAKKVRAPVKELR